MLYVVPVQNQTAFFSRLFSDITDISVLSNCVINLSPDKRAVLGVSFLINYTSEGYKLRKMRRADLHGLCNPRSRRRKMRRRLFSDRGGQKEKAEKLSSPV